MVAVIHTDPIARFWAKVDKTDGCWLWRNPAPNGYGVFWNGHKLVGAHRYSYAIHYEVPPSTLSVCHHCDTPACVRPDHLFLGTQKQNSLDMVAKGRAPKGGHITRSKITETQANTIRSLYATGLFKQRTLATMFSVSQPNIGYIVRGETWRQRLND